MQKEIKEKIEKDILWKEYERFIETYKDFIPSSEGMQSILDALMLNSFLLTKILGRLEEC